MPKKLDLDKKIGELLRPALKLDKFFKDKLSLDSVRMLFPQSGLYRYDKDEYILCQGDESKDLYIISSGSVTITKTMGTAGAELARLKPGDIFGEIALIRDGVRVASVIASGDCKVFRLDYRDIQSLMTGYPELADHLKELARQRAGG
jgi:CRP-like cAMP-binding protein